MKKRIIAVACSMVLIASMVVLTGCGGSGGSGSGSSGTTISGSGE